MAAASGCPHQRSDYLLPGDRVALDGSSHVERDPHWSASRLDARSTSAAATSRSTPPAARADDRTRSGPTTPSRRPTAGSAERFRAHFESLGDPLVVLPGPDRHDASASRCSARRAAPGTRTSAPTACGRPRRRRRARRLQLTRRRPLARRASSPAAPAGRSCCSRCGSPPRREPDHYNDYLVGLLKHADLAALRAVEEFEALATRPRRSWSRRRHAASRSAATARTRGRTWPRRRVVDDGVLRCLGHNFEFDLDTGECLNARCDPLTVDQAPSGCGRLGSWTDRPSGAFTVRSGSASRPRTARSPRGNPQSEPASADRGTRDPPPPARHQHLRGTSSSTVQPSGGTADAPGTAAGPGR